MSREKVTYGSYLKVPELLTLQQRVSEPLHHDEMLFIISHQVHELWFKQILHELGHIQRTLDEDRVLTALKAFKRVHAVQRVLIEQIDVLETMTPQEFNAFRSLLRPASGFQSVQFREIEFASGGGSPKVLEYMHDDPALPRARARLEEPTLYESFLGLLKRRGLAVPEALLASPGASRGPREINDELSESLKLIYEASVTEDPARYDLYLLCEAMVDYDELFMHWRARHVRMVERTIGMKTGTGGSQGAAYLAATLSARFFPELWDVRTRLGA